MSQRYFSSSAPRFRIKPCEGRERPRAAPTPSAAQRCCVAYPRHSFGAKIRVPRRAPESAVTRFRDGARGVAGADPSARPPGHRHVAAVDGVQPAVRMAPKDALRAVRPDREGRGGDPFAASLPAVRLWPVRDLLGMVRHIRRVATAYALILSELAPEGAAGAVLRTNWFVRHRLSFR